MPLCSAARKSIACPQASQQRTRRWTSIIIFSGCGALDLALLPNGPRPCYIVKKEFGTRQVLQVRAADGSLPRGSIIDHVVDISGETLQGLREKAAYVGSRGSLPIHARPGSNGGLREADRASCSKSFASLMNALPCVWFSWRMLMPVVHWSRCGVCWMHVWTAILVRAGYLYRPLQLVALRSGSVVFFSSQTRRVCT